MAEFDSRHPEALRTPLARVAGSTAARRPTDGWPAAFTRPSTPNVLVLPLHDAGPHAEWVGRSCRAGEPLAPGVIAPIGGRIEAIETARTIGGRVGPALRLAVDAAMEEPAPIPSISFDRAMAELEGIGQADLAEWTGRLTAAGVHADRWTSPDWTRQLHAAAATPIRAVVCAATDVDPELNLNVALLRDAPAEVVAGAALLGKLVGAGVWLAVDEGTPAKSIEAACDAARLARVRIVTVAAEFPNSHPALMLRRIMKVGYDAGQLPTHAGVVWLDAAAATAVGRNWLRGSPASHQPIVVFDGLSSRRRRLIVPRGMALRDVLAAINLNPVGLTLFVGGPIRDRRVSLDDVVDADETTIHALPISRPVTSAPCVRCGDCLDGCPTRVDPIGILDAAQRRDVGRANQLGLSACIECGVCSFTCPARLPLLQTIRAVRAMTEA